jgi:hypothetical protein
MSNCTITHGEMSVEKDETKITIGGTKIEASIEGIINFTFLREQEGGIGDRMENATPGSEEITIDSVDLTVTLYEPTENAPYIQFETTSIDFYEEHFGELECEDIVGYI